MSPNQKIHNLYKDNWVSLQRSLEPLLACQYTNPFLIAFDEDLLSKADLKVMIFGQETKGWGGRFGMLSNPEDLVAIYEKFFCQKKFYGGYGKSSFWKAFRYFERQIQTAYPTKSIYFSWNNINKIGKSKGKTGVSAEARAVERKTFTVIADEVLAFNPDIIIFLTGPNRDGDIDFHFNGAEFSSVNHNIKTRALAKVCHESLPERTIRMYHPSYYGGFHQFKEIALQAITSQIRNVVAS